MHYYHGFRVLPYLDPAQFTYITCSLSPSPDLLDWQTQTHQFHFLFHLFTLA